MEILKNLTSLQTQCVFAVIIGISLRLIINRRRFNRRSSTGQQQFKSYFPALLISFIEKLFILVANVIILGGIIIFLTGK